MESDFGLPEGFVASLGRDDDWSFIVKAHALLEASLTHMLIEALRREELRDVIAKLGPTLKMKFAEALDLLTKRERACYESVFAIRNLLAHDISHVQFNLQTYVRGLSDDRRRELAFNFQPYRPAKDHESVVFEGVETPFNKLAPVLFEVSPKRVIHQSVTLLVAVASERKLAEKRKRDKEMSATEFAKRLTSTLNNEDSAIYRERVRTLLESLEQRPKPTSS